MNKVKYIHEYKYYSSVTHNKVYDVIKYIFSDAGIEYLDRIVIINDENLKCDYYIYNGNKEELFIDAIEEYRNEVIDDILK